MSATEKEETAMGIMSDLAKRLSGARRAITELHDEDQRLRAEHAVATKARREAASAHAPVEEILQEMDRLVDEHAASWAVRNARLLLDCFSPGRIALKPDGRERPLKPSLPDHWFGPGVSIADLVGISPSTVKARLAEIVRGASYTPGAPTADRQRLLEEAAARITEIERGHEQLVDLARSLDPPIMLAYLPVVQARKDAEAAQRQREEQKRRAVPAQMVDDAGPGRAVPSPYLQKGEARG